MSRRANPMVIGGFVVGAIGLLLAGVVLFGTGKFLDERITVVAFFEGSVTGLQVGAPVEFRGVPVGSVTAIRALYDPRSTSFVIPVYMGLTRGAVVDIRPEAAKTTPELELQRMVERGLRARLEIRSLVTGQSYVDLDIHDEAPAKLVGAEVDYIEIPTVPSRREKVVNLLDEVDLVSMAAKAALALDGINEVLHSPHLQSALENAAMTAETTNALATKLDARLDTISEATMAVLEQARRSLDETESLLQETLETLSQSARNVDERMASTAGELEQTLVEVRALARDIDAQVAPLSASARDAMDRAAETFQTTHELLDAESRTRYNLDVALEELAAAARAVRLMAEYIEQNPDALIKGKNR